MMSTVGLQSVFRSGQLTSGWVFDSNGNPGSVPRYSLLNSIWAADGHPPVQFPEPSTEPTPQFPLAQSSPIMQVLPSSQARPEVPPQSTSVSSASLAPFVAVA